MLSSDEKYRLILAHRDELHYVAAVVLKCAACLLIISGITVIGLMTDAEHRRDAGQMLAQHKERASIADARARLEERRARFASVPGQRRGMAGALISGADDKAAGTEPVIDEVTLLLRVSD